MASGDEELNRLSTMGDGPARTQLLEDFAKELTDCGWSERDIFGVQMAVEESVSNAFHHGNNEGSLGQVEIGWRITSNEIVIEVHDHGDGFEETDINDPTDLSNLENFSGRGLLLMRSYMNEVNFLDGGTTIVMKKHRPAEPS